METIKTLHLDANAGSAPGAARPLNVCVFCGARSGSREALDLARETGRLLGARGHRLVYGAGGSGLMGELAWAAFDAGAEITGVVPRFLYERERGLSAPPYEAVVTETMFERKQIMVDRSDAFLALPGGYGTLDEVMEIVSLKYLDACPKPLVLLDADDFWESFTATDRTLRRRGFVDAAADRGFEVSRDPAEALDLIGARSLIRAGTRSPVPAVPGARP
ncbi:TIGR00730 family Rossman fold protein [Catenulispora sp. NF23]|uniref:Cytokinin riboside 5'-monophosphate phosphoribohydrolase n=1 Tax=Catenulispora pinistramenti TaxID=2705254 RepID=A0ABS5KM80_9ACTN|nr:TIGR00730 family Rossman fold protein [Catenulispora pinistramenti]MBS2532117.1 TIGR00730 family Rossman fold protein [Catenulispora pinistramenti]MBS2547159.1 TIGR00730 family Rossman fold protein [Catenulispora pinistramenti]